MATIPITPYRAQLVDSDGLPVAWIPFKEGTFEEEANQPSRLTLDIPVDLLAPSTSQQVLIYDPATEAYVSAFDASLLAPPYRIHLYDETPTLIQEFRIIRKSKVMSGGEHSIRVECEDMLSQLAQEIVTSYETTTLVGLRNPNFTSSSKWTRGTGWTIASGVATCAAASGVLTQGNAIPDISHDVDYKIVYTVSGYSAGTMTVSVGGVSGTARSANGTYEETITVPGTATDRTVAFTPNAAGVMSIDNVGIQLLAETVEDILTAISGFQNFSPSINFDMTNVASSIKTQTRGAKIENTSILSVLNSLRESGIGGYFYVALEGGVREFHWATALESDTGKTIRLGHNMLGVEETTEYDKLATIIYPKGIGEGDGALTLPVFADIPDIYWPFNGHSRDLVTDAGTYDLTMVNTGIQWFTDGAKVHGAARFNAAATPGYLRAAIALRPLSPAWTIEGWFRPDTLPGSGAQMTIWCESSSSDADPYYALEIDNNGTNTRAQIAIVGDDGAASAGFPKRGSTSLSAGTWYHFALYDTGSAVRLYINGVAQFAETAYSVSGYTTDQFQVGLSRRSSTLAKKFDGAVDDFRIYQRAMTAGEIGLDYNNGVVTNGYILDITNATTYGTRPAKFTDKSINHPDTLFKASIAFLARYSTPYVSYSASAAALDQAINETELPGTLGSELVTNGEFTTDLSGWTDILFNTPPDSSNAVFDSGRIKLTAGNSVNLILQSIGPLTANTNYQFSIDIEHAAIPVGTAYIQVYLYAATLPSSTNFIYQKLGSSGPHAAFNGNITVNFTPSTTDSYYVFIETDDLISGGLSPATPYFDNISVRSLDPAEVLTFEEMTLGATMNVVNEILGLSTRQTLIRRTLNLANPLDIQIELANRSNRLSDQFSEVFDLTSLLNSAAVTQIGAGQVVIQGSFSVIDWTDGSSTTINGGNITTGTITADAIFVDELSALTATTGSLVIRDPEDAAAVAGPADAAIRTGNVTAIAPSGGGGSGTGFIIGKSGAFRFGQGTTSGNYLHYDGASTLDCKGLTITATAISASTIEAESLTYGVLNASRAPISTQLDSDNEYLAGRVYLQAGAFGGSFGVGNTTTNADWAQEGRTIANTDGSSGAIQFTYQVKVFWFAGQATGGNTATETFEWRIYLTQADVGSTAIAQIASGSQAGSVGSAANYDSGVVNATYVLSPSLAAGNYRIYLFARNGSGALDAKSHAQGTINLTSAAFRKLESIGVRS